MRTASPGAPRSVVVRSLVFAMVGALLGSSCAVDRPDRGSGDRPLAGATVRSLRSDRRVALDAAGRPMVVNLWAPWCVPCRTELPVIDAFARRHPEVRVLGIAARGDRREAATFARAVGVSFPMAVDDTGAVFRSLAVSGLPVTAFLRADGTVGSVHRGRVDADDLEAGLASAATSGAGGKPAASPGG